MRCKEPWCRDGAHGGGRQCRRQRQHFESPVRYEPFSKWIVAYHLQDDAIPETQIALWLRETRNMSDMG